MENEQAAIALLLFRVGPVLCCAPADPVQTIIAPQKLTRPPGSNAARPGIFYHAEHVVTVSELRHRFGVDEADREQPGRMVITLQGEEFIAYWVDEIIEVLDTPEEGWGEAPAYLPKGVFSKTLLLKDQIYLFANFADFENLPEGDYLSQYFERLKNNELADSSEEALSGSESISTVTQAEPTTPNVTETTEDNIEAVTAEDEATATEVDTDPQSLAEDTAQAEIEQTEITSTGEPPVSPSPEPATTPETPITTDETVESEEQAPQPVETAEPLMPQEEHATPDPVSEETPEASTTQHSEPEVKDEPIPDDTDEPEPTAEEAAPATTDYLRPVPATVPESERPPEKPPIPWKTLAASLILFISLGIGGGYYLLSSNDKEEPGVTREAQSVAPGSESSDEEQQAVAEEETVPQEEEAIETSEVESREEETVSEPDATTNTDGQDVATEKEDTAEQQGQAGDEYRAEIKPDNKGVTIVLHAPDEKPALKEPVKKSSPDAAKQKAAATSGKQAKNNKEEIIHIVIKGDTLWAIAEHYVDNPYKYPQLARLSKIKNPDRIYPGNRVRILRYLQNDHK